MLRENTAKRLGSSFLAFWVILNRKLHSAESAFVRVSSEFQRVLVWESFEHLGTLAWLSLAQTSLLAPEQDSASAMKPFPS